MDAMKKDYLEGISEKALARENSKFYIPLSANDADEMLKTANAESLQDLFSNIPPAARFQSPPDIGESMDADKLYEFILNISKKNTAFESSFLENDWNVPQVLAEISKIRGLSTAYTPYQPERSQGSLITHWIYQCAMSALLGFEAVNCSLYDRSTAIWEAVTCAARLAKKQTALFCESLPKNDIEVSQTFASSTSIKLKTIPFCGKKGKTDPADLRKILAENSDIACLVFPQSNKFGILENVDEISDLCDEFGVRKIAVIEPALLAKNALKPPSEFGANGADIAVGEACHLASSPSFGGPTLGIFAIRFNDKNKNDIRQAPGRFVGRAKDIAGRDCFTMVLATREQHIRKEKATSNICSNQAFIATLAGASLLAKGAKGLQQSSDSARAAAKNAFEFITKIEGFEYPFEDSEFFNSFTLRTPKPAQEIIDAAAASGILIGTAIAKNLLKISFSDKNSGEQSAALFNFLKQYGSIENCGNTSPEISQNLLRINAPEIPTLAEPEILDYYKKLGDSNISPDSACYPLGSCTMKYNPYINDALANLEGFANSHPQAPAAQVQGCLEILWMFADKIKKITGLDAVACQPVAGAQGELCAIKMFQAWQRDNSKTVRDIILIPSSAHGTNFATAASAGFDAQNIISVKAGDDGQLSIEDLKSKISEYTGRVSAIMITNPNTSGILENRFAEIAEIVHSEGGLVFMDGANFNAVAGQLNLKKIGVDAVHNNLHKTWSISHGGGGPGDAFVAVDEKLKDYIPSYIVEKSGSKFLLERPSKSIGSVHSFFGNFAHKIRALAYIMALGGEGVQAMSGHAVLAARYMFEKLKPIWKSLPENCENEPRMHEFILTLSPEDFESFKRAGIEQSQAVARTGKLFLDYGFHAPTVAFPEVRGLMIEPTESYAKSELDRLSDAIVSIKKVIRSNPQSAAIAPRFTPIDRVDETEANRKPVLSEKLSNLPDILPNRLSPDELAKLSIAEIEKMIAD